MAWGLRDNTSLDQMAFLDPDIILKGHWRPVMQASPFADEDTEASEGARPANKRLNIGKQPRCSVPSCDL